MKILIGTHNPAKQHDLGRSFGAEARRQGIDIELVFPQEIGITTDIEESGTTFEENSRLKATYFYDMSKLPTISDDGGIMITALNNEPGVYTRRWIGHDKATDQEIISYMLKRTAHLHGPEERKTVFAACVTYYDGTHLIQEMGKTEGYIAEEALKNYKSNGFPMRALFIHKNGKYYDELTPEEHEMYNHRDKAVRKLIKKMKYVVN